LSFAGEKCAGCGETGPAGACVRCGDEISVEPDEATLARVAAIGPLRERARSLAGSFEGFPEPHIRVTTQQLTSVVVDADLPSRAIELIQFAHRVQELDLKEPAAIGRETRRAVVEVLDAVECVRDEARLFSAFTTDDELAELPLLVSRLGLCGARVVATVIEVMAAETFADASKAAGRMQDALEPPQESDRISELLRNAPDLAGLDDIDARISVALGREGTYTDELGLPDPVQIFAPGPEERTPFSSLARGTGRYLAHLLDTSPDELEDAHAFLAISAIPLAILDRPFEHHRRAELLRALIREGVEHQPEAVSEALSKYEDHAGQSFETSMRIRRQLRLLATGDIESHIDVVETAVEIYRRFAESHFRAGVRCVLAVRAAAEWASPPSDTLLLGDIEGRLAGWHTELGRSLRTVVERDLRNAEAHEEYRVDPETLEVVFSDRRMTLDEIVERTDSLTGALASIEAAVACYGIDSGRVQRPQWLEDGEHPRLVELLLRMISAGFGTRIEDMTQRSSLLSVSLAEDPPTSDHQARTVLFAARALIPHVEQLEAYVGERLVAAFAGTTLDSWRDAPEVSKEFALLAALYESVVRCGRDRDETLADAVASSIRVILNVDLAALIESPSARKRQKLVRRLTSVAQFASRERASAVPELARTVVQLRAACEAARLIARDPRLWNRLMAPLEALEEWANSRTVDWYGGYQ
jgi:hypothetical protein